MAGPGGKEVGRLNLKVLPDTTQFGRSLKAYVGRIERQVQVRIPTSLDTRNITAEMAALSTKLEATKPDVEIEVKPDVETVRTRVLMAELLAQLKVMARAGRPTIRPDVDGTRAIAGMAVLQTMLGTTGQASGGVGRQIALWAPLIFAAASLIAGIAPALAALIPLVGGVALGVGAIALGWEQVKDVVAPIKEAFADVRKEIGLVLTAGLKPLISEFASSFVPILVDGLTAVSGLINAAARNFLEFFNSSKGMELTAGFLVAMTTALQPLTQLAGPLSEVFLRLGTAAAPALQMMSEAILQVTENFAGWLEGADASSAITESMEILGHALRTVGKFIRDIFPPLFAAAPAVVAAFGSIGEVLGVVLNAMTPLFTFMSEHQQTVKLLAGAFAGLALAAGVVLGVMAVVGLIMSSTAAIIAAAIGAVVGAVIVAYSEFGWFRAVVQGVMASVMGVVSGVISVVVAAFKLGVVAVASVVAIFKVLRAGVSAAMSAVAAFVSSRVAAMKATFAGIAGVVTTVIGFFGRLRSGAADRLESLLSFVRGVPGKVKSGLGDLGGLLTSAGRDMIRGLIGGIKDMAGAAVDAAKGVAKSAVSGAKSLLGINSPSRVFRDEVGKWIPLGIVAGIAKSLPRLDQAIQNMVVVPSVPAPDFAPYDFDPTDFDSPGPGGAGGGDGNTYIDVHPSEGMDEQTLAQHVGNQFAWRNRR
ncbi:MULTISPECIES: hypothetical protein [unclassified Aeromicrobium]|uniref:phage tail protein n=1 Tax=unclassified Aeromicrobium TaxID=2633570 RepID=UPI00288C1CBA|nr:MULTISPECIES: hypothetical protein [unclassified Aeromicrobium]